MCQPCVDIPVCHNYMLQAPMLQSQLNGICLPAQSMGARALAQAQASALQQQFADHQLASQHIGNLQQQVAPRHVVPPMQF